RHTRSDRDWSSDVCSSDLLLLVSGIALARQLGAEGVRSWLPVKMVALIVYIVLGTIALRRGRTRAAKTAAALAAVLVFLYMVGRSEERRVGKEWRARGWRR